jgi:hypothetical protein
MNPPAYEVENDLDFDFFAALKHMQSVQPEPETENENACLITSEPLNSFHVTLECGHKFNYEPLYQEVIRQKGRLGIHNYHEKIGTHQIKCPYCRTHTNQLLPCITGQHPVIKRLNGVNAPASMCMPGIACSFNSCRVNAFYEHASKPYCLRHVKAKESKSKSNPESESCVSVRCAAEIQSGKNKGKQCALNATTVQHLCKKHSKCNVIVYQMQ